jgi:hypothetical protein
VLESQAQLQAHAGSPAIQAWRVWPAQQGKKPVCSCMVAKSRAGWALRSAADYCLTALASCNALGQDAGVAGNGGG